MATTKQPEHTDKHVGARLRMRRLQMKLSQTDLALLLGVKEKKGGITFQQVQKYEKGANRMSASRLYQAAVVLRVPVAYFFDGLPDPRTASGATNGTPANGHDYAATFLSTSYGHSVARGLPQLKPTARKAVLSLIEALAE